MAYVLKQAEEYGDIKEYLKDANTISYNINQAKIFRTKAEAIDFAKRLDYTGLNRRYNSFYPIEV